MDGYLGQVIAVGNYGNILLNSILFRMAIVRLVIRFSFAILGDPKSILKYANHNELVSSL